MDTAIVTGGAQGIGKAITQKLMDEGVFVYVFDNDRVALDDFSEEQDEAACFKTVLCDVGDNESLEMNIDWVLSKSAGVKYLVNNAAIIANKPMDALDLDEWNRVLAVNLTSCFLTVKYLSVALKATMGSVVNLCSTRAFMSEPHTEAYSASKGGIYALTHAQAISLQPMVRVNCISPGWIDVTSWQKKSTRQLIKWDQKHHDQHPAGRIGTPEDIAGLAWFLLSDKSGFITGQNFIADGGMTRKMIYEQ